MGSVQSAQQLLLWHACGPSFDTICGAHLLVWSTRSLLDSTDDINGHDEPLWRPAAAAATRGVDDFRRKQPLLWFRTATAAAAATRRADCCCARSGRKHRVQLWRVRRQTRRVDASASSGWDRCVGSLPSERGGVPAAGVCSLTVLACFPRPAQTYLPAHSTGLFGSLGANTTGQQQQQSKPTFSFGAL